MTHDERNVSRTGLNASQAEPLSLADLWPIVRCHKWLLTILALIGGGLGYAFGSMQIPQFTALASVLIEPQRGESARISDATGAGLELSSGTLAAETRLITSPRFVLRIIDDLDMRSHPEYQFSGEEETEAASAQSWYERGLAIWDELLNGESLATQVDDDSFDALSSTAVEAQSDKDLPQMILDSQDAGQEEQLSLNPLTLPELDLDNLTSGMVDENGEYVVDHDETLLAVMDRLSTDAENDSFLISISYSSSDPNLSAQVANYAAELYVAWNLDNKLSGIRLSSQSMSSRLASLRDQVTIAENRVERYTQENDLLSSAQGSLLIEDEMVSIRNDLNQARADLASEQGQYSLLQASRDNTEKLVGIAGADVAASLVSLQSDLKDHLRDRAELEITYGRNHPRMVDVQASIDDVERKLAIERGRVIEAQLTKVRIEEERVETFQQILRDLRQRSASARERQLQLRELEREAEAKRELYKALLLRFQETDQERDAIQADARIVKQALVPEDSSVPPPLAFALVGFTGLLSVGAFGVLVRERFRSGFTRLRDAENSLGYNVLSVIPTVAGYQKKRKKKEALWQNVSRNPSSAFGESVAKVYVRLAHQLERMHSSNKVVMITSAIPSEGKTTLSSCLAVYAAKMNERKRVLIIDCDFRRPAISQEFVQRNIGFVDYLMKDPQPLLSKITYNTGIKNLDYLPITSPALDSTFLVSSEKMPKLISEVRASYDLIICDCPPVLAINDTKILAKWSDLFLMVVKWSATPENTVKAAIDQLLDAEASIGGVVFTQVNMAKYNNYNYLEGGKYHEEYTKLYTS